MKKAQGLSLNTIIVAAIVLIVLVVLWAIFTGRMGNFANSLREADAKCKELCVAAGYTTGDTEGTGCSAEDNEFELRKVQVKDDDGNIAQRACCCS